MSDSKEELEHWYEPRNRCDIDIVVEGHTFHCHQLDLVRKSSFFNVYIEACKDQLKVVFPPADASSPPLLNSWKMIKSILDHIHDPDKWRKQRVGSYEEMVNELIVAMGYLGIKDSCFVSRYEKKCCLHINLLLDPKFWQMFLVTKSIPDTGVRQSLKNKLVSLKVSTSRSLMWLQSAPDTLDAADWKEIHLEMEQQQRNPASKGSPSCSCNNCPRKLPLADSDSD